MAGSYTDANDLFRDQRQANGQTAEGEIPKGLFSPRLMENEPFGGVVGPRTILDCPQIGNEGWEA